MPMQIGSAPKPDSFSLIRLQGGWDLISPTLTAPPGVVRDSSNFEIATSGGYSRIAGYERYDGRPSPSNATYAIIQVDQFDNTPSVNTTLTGFSSGATSIIVAVVTSPTTYMVVTKVSGTYGATEEVRVGGTKIGDRVTQTVVITPLLNAQYLNLAADEYRDDIGQVPGSGPVRGVATLTVAGVDKTYAFRNNSGGTAVDLYVASGSGWTQITFPEEVSFTAAGAGTPVDGNTLTQGGVTATIRRVMHQSGSFASSTGAGRFIITNRSGGNFAAGAATAGAVGCTLSGIQTAITLSPGGKFEFITANFFGQAGTLRLYGCDGVNRAFEFDGSYLCPITTGTSPDTPKHIAQNAKHLFLGVASSIIHSGPGLPYNYTAGAGAGEIATGDTITGFLNAPGAQTTAALIVYGLQQTAVLYGTGLSTWNFTIYKYGAGGLHYTMQNMLHSYALDDPGITSLQATQAYGNFSQSALTVNIFPFIEAQRTKASCSSLSRLKSQYRLFFSDGIGLFTTIVNGKNLGAMKTSFPDVPFVMSNADAMRSNGNEELFFGNTGNGYVMQMEKGSSFDGAAIDAFFTLNWNALGNPRMRKRFRKAVVETQGNFYAEFQFGYQLGYGTGFITQPSPATYTSGFAPPPAWDAFVWDQFVWDGATILPTEIELRGTAENIQIAFTTTTDYIYPFTINSILVNYTDRRTMR